MTMDTKERLESLRGPLRERAMKNMEDHGGPPLLSVNDALDVLRAAGVTLPEPPGPVKPAEAVTSEETAIAYEQYAGWPYEAWLDAEYRTPRRHALDAAMPLLARDHGYVKAGAASPANVVSLAEVERRARAWFGGSITGWSPAYVERLVAVLTASADTGAASTREGT